MQVEEIEGFSKVPLQGAASFQTSQQEAKTKLNFSNEGWASLVVWANDLEPLQIEQKGT